MSKLYHLAFSHCLGIGPMRFKQLLAHFGDAEKAYRAGADDLKKVLGVKLAQTFGDFRRHFGTGTVLEALAQKNISLLTLGDKNYPRQLAQISDPPICLYVKGDCKILQNHEENLTLAVVGTRKPTSYGLAATDRLVEELAAYGVVIVSGLALGIDAQAHWTALENETTTIAVLGCGVDIIYPPSNKDLYQKIIAQGGAIVSEFPPETTVHPGLFVARNRIIAGLSRGVLVVEGAKDSGALITARYAAEQGRDVFAVPAPITSPLSHAPNFLIKQGGKMVAGVEDILEEYQISVKTAEKADVLNKLRGLEKEVAAALMREPATADDLALALKKPIAEVLHAVTLLEITGLLSKNQEGKFFRR